MKIRKLFWVIACTLIILSTAVQASSKGTFTLEEVLSPPYPSHLVSAKNADRIAWVFHSKGERNIWTAAAPDFKPVNLTGFVRDEVFEIPCQIFLPKGAKKGSKLPGVVYTHGGPVRQMLLGWHYMGSYFYAYAFNQHSANHGYVVLSVNYRSGIGYGRSFRNAPDTGRQGVSEYQDILAGAEYLQSRPEVDPERIGKWGLSYGGLLTAMALARNSDIFKVGVDMAGVHDWSMLRRRGPDESWSKLARDSSPIASLETWKSPVLLIHGDNDRNVPFQQTTDLVQKLRAKEDVYFELMIVPDEPHVFLLYKNRMECYKRAFEFIDRFIGK
jgi:dipeptidyl-peptidase-4